MAGNKRKSLAANAAKPPAGGVENAPVDTPSASAFDQFKAHVAKRQVNLEALLARNSAPDAVPAAPAADGAQLAKARARSHAGARADPARRARADSPVLPPSRAARPRAARRRARARPLEARGAARRARDRAGAAARTDGRVGGGGAARGGGGDLQAQGREGEGAPPRPRA